MDPKAIAKRDQAVRDIDSALRQISRAQSGLYRTRGLGTERCASALDDLMAHYRKVRADLNRLA